MKYPTMSQVEKAEITQLCRWTRFLPSAGTSALNGPREEFEEISAYESDVMDLILERQKELGGMTPEISKSIGWD